MIDKELVMINVVSDDDDDEDEFSEGGDNVTPLHWNWMLLSKHYEGPTNIV